jgi:sulfur relay (sulfurtransferase) complex TusBCD TusD component (DsrE family)
MKRTARSAVLPRCSRFDSSIGRSVLGKEWVESRSSQIPLFITYRHTVETAQSALTAALRVRSQHPARSIFFSEVSFSRKKGRRPASLTPILAFQVRSHHQPINYGQEWVENGSDQIPLFIKCHHTAEAAQSALMVALRVRSQYQLEIFFFSEKRAASITHPDFGVPGSIPASANKFWTRVGRERVRSGSVVHQVSTHEVSFSQKRGRPASHF